MKKLKQGLLLAVLLLLGAYVTIPLIKQEIQHQHTQKLNELYKSTGYDYLRTEIAGSEGNDMIIGIYEDGDNRLPAGSGRRRTSLYTHVPC